LLFPCVFFPFLAATSFLIFRRTGEKLLAPNTAARTCCGAAVSGVQLILPDVYNFRNVVDDAITTVPKYKERLAMTMPKKDGCICERFSRSREFPAGDRDVEE
jgi:cobalamin biosynthesis protein CobD/CbiB